MENANIVPGFDDLKDPTTVLTLSKLETVPSGMLVKIKGYVDTYNSGIFQKRIEKLYDAGYFRIVFDCAEVTYLSSTGIGALANIFKETRKRGGDMVLLNVQPRVFEVIDLLGFSSFFLQSNSINGATEMFGATDALVKDVFPLTFNCPICDKKLKAPRAARFRCPACKVILDVQQDTQIFIG